MVGGGIEIRNGAARVSKIVSLGVEVKARMRLMGVGSDTQIHSLGVMRGCNA